MSVNKYLPHLFVIPEDDANRQIANGFSLQVRASRQMQVLQVAGGWRRVLECFQKDHISEMDGNENRLLVLLIDFDRQLDRLTEIRAAIPGHLSDRVFVLGALTDPEDLKRADLGAYEDIGSALAEDCREETNTIWGHSLLKHNSSELARLRPLVRPMLF